MTRFSVSAVDAYYFRFRLLLNFLFDYKSRPLLVNPLAVTLLLSRINQICSASLHKDICAHEERL